MTLRRFFLFIAFLLGAWLAEGDSLIVTNGETLEMGGTYTFDNVLISDGTVYLTNDTVITSSGDISILSGGTITWHYTTTNWIIEIDLPYQGGSFVAESGKDAWNLSLLTTSNLLCNGIIDLRGGAGQTHSGKAGNGGDGGYGGGDGEDGGDSAGGHGGQGATLFLRSSAGNIDVQNSRLVLSGGTGGKGGNGGSGGDGGDTSSGQGGDGGDGGASYGGNGGNGGHLVIRTKRLHTDNWTCLYNGGIGAQAGSGGEGGFLGFGSWEASYDGYGLMAEGGPWNGSLGRDGQSYDGLDGTNGIMDVIKQAEPSPRFENGQLSLGLDMTSTSATYIVESCPNLLSADWQTVGTFKGRSGGTNWVEASSNRSDKAFYRIQTVY